MPGLPAKFQETRVRYQIPRSIDHVCSVWVRKATLSQDQRLSAFDVRVWTFNSRRNCSGEDHFFRSSGAV